MTNKRLEAKRLVIFILLAFSISWIPAIICKIFGRNIRSVLSKYPEYHKFYFTIPTISGRTE